MFDWLLELSDSIRQPIVEMWHGLGINPIYGSTIVCLLITASYWKNYKNWDDQPDYMKSYLKSGIYATAVLVVISIVNLLTGFY
jgi:hypothetical protein